MNDSVWKRLGDNQKKKWLESFEFVSKFLEKKKLYRVCWRGKLENDVENGKRRSKITWNNHRWSGRQRERERERFNGHEAWRDRVELLQMS